MNYSRKIYGNEDATAWTIKVYDGRSAVRLSVMGPLPNPAALQKLESDMLIDLGALTRREYVQRTAPWSAPIMKPHGVVRGPNKPKLDPDNAQSIRDNA